MNRRDFLQTSAAALPFLTLAGKASAQQTQAAAVPFGPAYVRQIARDLATKSYQAPDEKLPDSLKDLDYDRYRAIRFADAWYSVMSERYGSRSETVVTRGSTAGADVGG